MHSQTASHILITQDMAINITYIFLKFVYVPFLTLSSIDTMFYPNSYVTCNLSIPLILCPFFVIVVLYNLPFFSSLLNLSFIFFCWHQAFASHPICYSVK